MKKIIYLVLICFMSSAPVFAREGSSVATKVIKSMEEAQASIVDAALEYTQTITYFSTGERQVTRGEIKMKEPNIYIYQRQPKYQHTYIDGKKMITYVPENKQAIIESWKEILENNILLAAALNFNKNYKNAKIDYNVTMVVQTDKEYCLMVKSVNVNENWKIYLNVDSTKFLVNSAIYENNNFKVEVKMHNYKLNTGLSDSIFEFNAPKDVEVVEM